jgi:hypothetical protein
MGGPEHQICLSKGVIGKYVLGNDLATTRSHVPTQGDGAPALSLQMKKATAMVAFVFRFTSVEVDLYIQCSGLDGVIWHKSSYELRSAGILSRMGNIAKSFIVAGWRGAAISATTYSGAELYGSDSGLGKRGVDRDYWCGGDAVVEVAVVVEVVSRAWKERGRGIGGWTECAAACGCAI